MLQSNSCFRRQIPRRIALVASSLVMGLTSWSTANDEVASNPVIGRAGLTIDWFTQSPVSVTDRIVDLELNVNEDNSTTYFVIEAGNYREVISERDRNAFGEPFGLDGAVGYIEVRKEVLEAELKRRGLNTEIKVDQYTLPETTLYLMSGEGLITAIDGDTGKTRWTHQVGDPRLPSLGLGVSNENVAAVNGSTVYFLEAKTGKLLWSNPCQYAVGAPPAISPDRVFVPLINGRMEVFSIEGEGINSTTLISYGAGTAKPLVTDRTIAWTCSNGSLNVAALYGKRSHEIAYRLNADDSIVSSPTIRDGEMYVASLDGFVYAITEKTGQLDWEVSLGEAIEQSPIPLKDKVYVITEDGNLHCLSAKDGRSVWDAPTPKIVKYIGASESRIYVSDRFGRLVTIDADSGTVLSRIEAGDISFVLPNYQTDRLYYGTQRGLIQCLHEVGSKIPYFHADFLEMKAKPAAADAAGEQPAIAAEDDPFSSPTGSKSQPQQSTAADDPFAIPQSGAGAGNSAKDAGAGRSRVQDDPFK